MAVGTTTDFNDTMRTIIRDAFVAIGVLEPGEAPEHEQSEWAGRLLNRLIKAWQAKGYNLWRATEGEITLVANQQSYTMGGTAPDFAARPLRIESARFVQLDGTEAPRMIALAREDYFNYPNKNAQGTSTTFYYDPGRDQGTLYIWPVMAAVNGEKIKFTYQRPYFDFDSAEDNPDVPQEWLRAVVANLGAEMSPTYYPGKLELQATHIAKAQKLLLEAEDFDREWGDVCFKLGEDEYR